MSEPRKPDIIIESTQRFRRASATVERLEAPQPDEWVTGEHYLGALDDTTQRLRAANGLRSEDVTVQPVVRLKTLRPRNLLERYLRLAAAVGLVGLALVFFFEAFTQSAARLARGGQPTWRAVTIEVSSNPGAATVIVGETTRGRTPLSLTERCRGRSIRVRVEAPGHATWAWAGLCPPEGALTLSAQLQPLP